MSEYKLTSEIIKLSEASQWEEAKTEWSLQKIYEDKDCACLCGHFPISEICVLKNKLNGECVTVGNCCVKKFIGLPSEKIFQAMKRIRKDNLKSLNTETIQHAFKSGWITGWERKFSQDIMRKRKLSEKQLDKKMQINQKIIQNYEVIGNDN